MSDEKKEIMEQIRVHIHDINNQLTVIKGKGEKLLFQKEFKENPDLHKIVDKADKTAVLVRELRELVQDLE